MTRNNSKNSTNDYLKAFNFIDNQKRNQNKKNTTKISNNINVNYDQNNNDKLININDISIQQDTLVDRIQFELKLNNGFPDVTLNKIMEFADKISDENGRLKVGINENIFWDYVKDMIGAMAMTDELKEKLKGIGLLVGFIPPNKESEKINYIKKKINEKLIYVTNAKIDEFINNIKKNGQIRSDMTESDFWEYVQVMSGEKVLTDDFKKMMDDVKSVFNFVASDELSQLNSVIITKENYYNKRAELNSYKNKKLIQYHQKMTHIIDFYKINKEKYNINPLFVDKVIDSELNYLNDGLDIEIFEDNMKGLLNKKDIKDDEIKPITKILKNEWEKMNILRNKLIGFVREKSSNDLEEIFKDRPNKKQAMDPRDELRTKLNLNSAKYDIYFENDDLFGSIDNVLKPVDSIEDLKVKLQNTMNKISDLNGDIFYIDDTVNNLFKEISKYLSSNKIFSFTFKLGNEMKVLSEEEISNNPMTNIQNINALKLKFKDNSKEIAFICEQVLKSKLSWLKLFGMIIIGVFVISFFIRFYAKLMAANEIAKKIENIVIDKVLPKKRQFVPFEYPN